MRFFLRFLLVAAFCVTTAVGAVAWLMRSGPSTARPPGREAIATAERSKAGDAPATGTGATQPDGAVFDVILDGFDDGGFTTASRFMAPIKDGNSLAELREAVLNRGRRGTAELTARHEALGKIEKPTREQKVQRVDLMKSLGFLAMYEGDFKRSATWFRQALDATRELDLPPRVHLDLIALLGAVALRQGEVDNCLGCVGPSSCLFPLDPAAVHKKPAGSREAVQWFTKYLEERPRDLRVSWMLNLAEMTLGEYPDKVPTRDRIPLGPFGSRIDVGRFENAALAAGLIARGPNLAGGSAFDDFNGDGLPDLFSSSLDADKGASLFINRGDGTFEDRSNSAGLDDQIYALNLRAVDYDNDGDLDVLLLRGAWEKPLRMSLLRNRGNGTFDDVTSAAGLGLPLQSEAAAWDDYDNDGDLDLFVAAEYAPAGQATLTTPGDPRNRSRLYRNRGDGTFEDVAPEAGVTNLRCGKGAAWGDYDGDGDLDLYVSNMGQPSRLYRNEGDGTFKDVAPDLGVTGTAMSFACWFWDYDNDGRLDIYVNDYRARSAEVLASALGLKINGASRPRLYRNLGADGFRDVTTEAGLDRAMAPMGSNFGDFDNDGFLDIYLGTGDMAYTGLDPNLLFKNVDGAHFVDVTTSSRTGHLQKGHGVSFADYDNDGDLDLFVEQGGAVPGDRGYNALFRNPGHGRHWLKVKLVGTRTNRSAVGAQIRVDVAGAGGATHSVYRTVGNNSSFGGNGLVELIGLGEATSAASLTVSWPRSKTTQTFHDIPADRSLEITEGADAPRVLPISAKAHATASP